MKIIRYRDKDGLEGHAVLDNQGQAFRLEGNLFEGPVQTHERVEPVKWLAPLIPQSILCIGLNYRLHAEETRSPLPEHPILFMKLPNSIQNPEDPIILPRTLVSDRVDYECELAVIIGKPARNVRPENALDYVFGYTAANDVSARDWQKNGGGGQWCRGKTFDTFCPLGPVLVTKDEIPDPGNLGIRTLLNGEVMQSSNTNDMIFDVSSLIAFLSGSTTLMPGTVILTGTPSGVGMARNPRVFLKEGDVVSIEIDQIGTLTNPVIAESISG